VLQYYEDRQSLTFVTASSTSLSLLLLVVVFFLEVATMINYTCQVIIGHSLCGLPLKKTPNYNLLTRNYFDLYVCAAGHRVLLLQSRETESDAKKDESH
jgi:hypothetical protein